MAFPLALADQTLIAILAAIIAPAAAYLGVRFAKSGRVNTSEADTLWREAGAIRLELRADVAELRRLLEEARLEHAKCQSLLQQHSEKIHALEDEIARLKSR